MRNSKCVFKMQGYTSNHVAVTNKAVYTAATWAEWIYHSGDMAYGVAGAEHTFSDVSSSYNYLPANFEASKKYLILLNIVSNNLSTKSLVLRDYLTGTYPTVATPGQIGNVKLVITTQATISTNRLGFTQSAFGDLGLKVKYKDIRVIELVPGSQLETDANTLTADQLAANIPYFQSTGIALLGLTNVLDRSRYKNNGTLSGGAVYKLLPTPLYVLDFTNPTSLVTVPKNASINDIAQFTVRGWFYYGGAGGNNQGRIFDKGGSIKGLAIDYANNRLRFRHGFSTQNGEWNSPTSGLVVGRFYQFQSSYDNSNVANNPVIVIDGTSVTVTRTTVPIGTASLDNASDLYFGNSISPGSTVLNGYESELEIYKGILTVAEGKRWYNASCRRYGKAVVV